MLVQHGDQEKRSRIANSHMMFLLTSHNVSSDLVQLYVENSGAVLEALSNLQKQPQVDFCTSLPSVRLKCLVLGHFQYNGRMSCSSAYRLDDCLWRVRHAKLR